MPQQRTHIPTDPSDHLFLLPDNTTLAATATAIDHRIQQQQQQPETRISLQAMADIVVLHRAMGAAAHRPIEMGTDMTIDMTTIGALPPPHSHHHHHLLHLTDINHHNCVCI